MKKASTPDELLNTEIKIVDEVGLPFWFYLEFCLSCHFDSASSNDCIALACFRENQELK